MISRISQRELIFKYGVRNENQYLLSKLDIFNFDLFNDFIFFIRGNELMMIYLFTFIHFFQFDSSHDLKFILIINSYGQEEELVRKRQIIN